MHFWLTASVLLSCFAICYCHGAVKHHPLLQSDRLHEQGCLQEKWFQQRLDHFHWDRNGTERTFQQRYIVCDEHWITQPDGSRGPIFFYAGNEGDVMMYVNATGLMWENAQEFGALVLFAEHRYYGKSEPLGPDSWKVDPSFLTVEQALADYAHLLWTFKKGNPGSEHSPIIAFGGSYGGMLAAWFRLKYPHIIRGAIAASAPIGSFHGVPGFNPSKFWEIVTRDATGEAGAAPDCAENVHKAFNLITSPTTDEVRGELQQIMRLCEPLQGEEDVLNLAYWLQGAFDAFAMGNYPYASSYISGDPALPLPAWPMRAACQHMKDLDMDRTALLEALRDAAGVLYNVSGTLQCYTLQTTGPAAGNTGPWDWQWCTEMMGQELPYYPTTGTSDMFWDQGPFDQEGIEAHCREAWGVKPRLAWSANTYGGLDLSASSNIVLSNGLYDPWSAFGVLEDLSESVVAVIIPEGAHHLDLMFSHPDDPPSVTAARKTEMEHVKRWVDHAQKKPDKSARS